MKTGKQNNRLLDALWNLFVLVKHTVSVSDNT